MPHSIRVLPSGHTFTANPDEPILDAALRHGLSFPYGCRGGACGSCSGKLVSGTIDYAGEEPMALTATEQATGQTLFCLARATSDLVIEVREIGATADIPLRMLPAKIFSLERRGEDVMILRLKLPDNDRLQFLAGQYVEFLLADGSRRAFSIANAPHSDDLLEFHIRHIPGGKFTDELFANGREKSLLRIEGPHGSFFMREESDKPMLMLATGTGFGPIKAIIEHAIAVGNQRPITLYWGSRSRDGLYYHELAEQWAQDYPWISYRPVLSRPDEAWQGRSGRIQAAVLADFDSLAGYELYACGHPEVVYSACEVLVKERQLASEDCFADAFEFARG
jgi:CDP-4-dehydro-6-deoxyglucose reductase, E3